MSREKPVLGSSEVAPVQWKIVIQDLGLSASVRTGRWCDSSPLFQKLGPETSPVGTAGLSRASSETNPSLCISSVAKRFTNHAGSRQDP